jgi:hypothetical protein
MLGFRRAAVHLALIALLVRGFLPVGWMPAAHGAVPLVMCSITQIADTITDGHTGDGDAVPGKDDPRAHENCAFSGGAGITPPDNMIFFTPVLQDGDLEDYGTVPVRPHQRQHAPQAPRAPPLAI